MNQSPLQSSLLKSAISTYKTVSHSTYHHLNLPFLHLSPRKAVTLSTYHLTKQVHWLPTFLYSLFILASALLPRIARHAPPDQTIQWLNTKRIFSPRQVDSLRANSEVSMSPRRPARPRPYSPCNNWSKSSSLLCSECLSLHVNTKPSHLLRTIKIKTLIDQTAVLWSVLSARRYSWTQGEFNVPFT